MCSPLELGLVARRVAPMAEVDLKPFLTLRRHLRIAHHIPGRIRLRAGPSIVKDLGVVDARVFDRVLGALHGIREFRANPRAGSIVVEYVPAEIRPDWWETLIHGDEAAAVALLRHLLQNELAPAVAAVQRDPGAARH
jgi:hypothetical protein